MKMLNILCGMWRGVANMWPAISAVNGVAESYGESYYVWQSVMK